MWLGDAARRILVKLAQQTRCFGAHANAQRPASRNLALALTLTPTQASRRERLALSRGESRLNLRVWGGNWELGTRAHAGGHVPCQTHQALSTPDMALIDGDCTVDLRLTRAVMVRARRCACASGLGLRLGLGRC